MTVTLQPAASLSAASGTGAELSALLHGAGVAPLDDMGWIRVTGEDRVRWLNGMVTNFVQQLAAGEGCYNFVLNAQGRIQGDLTAFAESDALVLRTSRSQVPLLIALLVVPPRSRLPTRSVPEMKNFDQVLVVVDAIVNPNWEMSQNADAATICDHSPQTRKILEQFDMTQERTSKALSSRVVVGANVGKQYL